MLIGFFFNYSFLFLIQNFGMIGLFLDPFDSMKIFYIYFCFLKALSVHVSLLLTRNTFYGYLKYRIYVLSLFLFNQIEVNIESLCVFVCELLLVTWVCGEFVLWHKNLCHSVSANPKNWYKGAVCYYVQSKKKKKLRQYFKLIKYIIKIFYII